MGLLDFFRRSSPSLQAGDEELFDDEFQKKLETLALVSRRVVAGRLRAQRRTKKTGSGIEFADHREYQPGDDLRYLDWNIYQRFDRLLVRLFEEEEDLPIYLLLDTSASMAFGQGRKLRYGKQICAALAYVGLSNLDRVCICTTGDDVIERMPETRGKGRIFKVFRFLRDVSPGGETDLQAAMKTFVTRHRRRGLAVLISDLFDPRGVEAGINILRYNKFEPYVLHVTDSHEKQLALRGDVLVYDCETGDEREVTVTETILRRYGDAYASYLHATERLCASRQVPYLVANVDVAVDEFVLHVLRRGGFLR